MSEFVLPNFDPELAEATWRAAVEQYWLLGNIGYWYLKPKQRTALADVRRINDPFFEASRRFGKTNTTLAFVCEESIKREGIITRWCEPLKNQCREIVMTEMDQIQSYIPTRHRFVWHSTDSYYQSAYSGSKIYLRGINDDRGESARGTKAHIIVADEFGSWKDPKYILSEVLGPQLLTTYGKLIITGTPPRDLTHPFYAMKDLAKLQGRFLQRLIYDQELVDWAQVEKIIADAGGWDAPGVRREYLCEKILDKNFAIIPEWDNKYVKPIEPDEYFVFYLKYDGLDIGVRDMTVCILAYYDFKKAKLMVIDEIVMRGSEMTTEKLAKAIKEKEGERWGVKWEEALDSGQNMRWRCVKPPHLNLRRVSDIDLLLINDLSIIHGIHFDATDKGALEEMVNEVRIWVGSGKVEIDPRCQVLIDCMQYGIWNEKRTEWERSDLLGHFDALAGLMYLIRNVDRKTNPIPHNYGKPETDFFQVEEKKDKTKQLKKLFNIK